VDGASDN
jgi:hypothetical protein